MVIGALRIMRIGLRRAVSWMAIYAVALHVILLGLASVATDASAAVNPFSVICHSIAHAGAAGDEAPGKSDLIPGHACEHCNLCSAVAPPPAPNVALFGSMAPARVLHVLRPVSAQARVSVTSDPKLARGPPQTT
jgi:hypothetical protein